MPRGRPKRKNVPTRQTALTASFLPLFKKPEEMIGKTITVPGNYWGSSATAGERTRSYVCAIKEFTLMHRPSPGATPISAYLLTELGEDGHGGTSDDFWMPYPTPMLEFYFNSHPEEKQALVNPLSVAGDAGGDERAVGEGARCPIALDSEDEVEKVMSSIVRSLVYEHLQEISHEKITRGKQQGRLKFTYKCKIVEDGKPCCSPVTIYGASTGPFFRHVRRFASKPGNSAHAQVLALLNESSSRQV